MGTPRPGKALQRTPRSPEKSARGAYAKPRAWGQAIRARLRQFMSDFRTFAGFGAHLDGRFFSEVIPSSGNRSKVVEDKTRQTRAAAIDYGQARIGVAVADELGMMAHPRPFVPAKPPARALRIISSQLKSEQVTHILVGLPRNMDGTEGLSARRARKFAEELELVSGLSIELVDERLTTVSALGLLRAGGTNAKDSRTKIDSASAAVMLQTWLDSKRVD